MTPKIEINDFDVPLSLRYDLTCENSVFSLENRQWMLERGFLNYLDFQGSFLKHLTPEGRRFQNRIQRLAKGMPFDEYQPPRIGIELPVCNFGIMEFQINGEPWFANANSSWKRVRPPYKRNLYPRVSNYQSTGINEVKAWHEKITIGEIVEPKIVIIQNVHPLLIRSYLFFLDPKDGEPICINLQYFHYARFKVGKRLTFAVANALITGSTHQIICVLFKGKLRGVIAPFQMSQSMKDIVKAF